MGYLLDTNHLIHLSNNIGPVVSRLDAVPDGESVITSILVVAELLYGAECSARREENIRIVEQQVAVLDEIIPITDAIARRFAALKAKLRARGRTKQDFDLIIAATALESGAILVTDDGGLLAGDIPDLIVENWCR